MSQYWSKFRCLKGGWVTLNANFRGKGASPTNDFWHQKSRFPGLSYGKKIAENFNRLSRVHQRHRRQTDRQTDGIAMASSEREREFTSAKNYLRNTPITILPKNCNLTLQTKNNSQNNKQKRKQTSVTSR